MRPRQLFKAPQAVLLRHPVFPVLLAAFVFALTGLILPPRSADAGVGRGLGAGGATVQLAPAGDPAAFRTMSRWGTDIESVEADPAATAAEEPLSDDEAELVKLGFIGLTLAADENAVLLTHPDGDPIRLTDGDSLPDGRTLVSVTDNALTLAGADGELETLVLFPRRSDPNTDG